MVISFSLRSNKATFLILIFILLLRSNCTAYWENFTIDETPGAGRKTSIATDSFNKAHVVYSVFDGYIKYATNSSGVWQSIVIDSVGSQCSIAVDKNNFVHIAYRSGSQLKYATNTSGSWNIETFSIDPDGIDIDIDSNNKVHISTNDYISHTLKYLTNQSGAWKWVSVDRSDTETSIAIDSEDKAHIVYGSNRSDLGDRALKYATNASGSWIVERIEDTYSLNHSIAVDSGGKIHLSYDSNNRTIIRYATNKDGYWSYYTVDVGQDLEKNSIDVDSNDKIHIVYHYWLPGYDLKYATNYSGDWKIEEINTVGNVGFNNSLQIDSENLLHVSYYDATNMVLKYATSFTDTNPPSTTITSQPATPVNFSTASFSFTATEAGSTFQCSLDGSAYAACSSPKSYSGLGDGSHSFSVKATDAAGNTDLTPASYSWTVDTAAPTVSASPLGGTYTAAQIVTLSANKVATIYYTSDGSTPTADSDVYSGPFSIADTTTLKCLAMDAAGNQSDVQTVVYTIETADDVGSDAEPASLLPKTGQARCYDSVGTEIDCSTQGQTQDGANQAGFAWPAPRFADNADGTVTDNLTGLVWAADANLINTNDPAFDEDASALPDNPSSFGDGAVTWQHALDYVKKLNAENFGGYNDWRLPNVNEMRSLLDLGRLSLALPADHLFANVQYDFYWTSTTFAKIPDSAWFVSANLGNAFNGNKSIFNAFVWPVRGGQLEASSYSLPKTGQTKCYDTVGTVISCEGTGQDGELQQGIDWPSSRFTDLGNGTVIDNLTNLNWTKDANAPGPSACTPAATKVWQEALDYIDCLNSNSYLGFTNWRLPNREELLSLIDFQKFDHALPDGHPFANLQSAFYWSSTSYASAPYSYIAWNMDLDTGYTGYYGAKTIDNSRVWPVRSINILNSVPTGTGVVVTPSADVGVEFDTVSTPGSLTVTPLNNPAPPANFRVVTGASYEITTTADYSGPVTICLDYSDAALADKNNEANIKLFHHNGQNWEDITTSVDTVNNRVCGVTYSFSPFVVAEPIGSTFYTITATVSGSGSISPAAGAITVSAGGSQTYTFTPDSGYLVQNVIVNNSSQCPLDSYTFNNVQANQRIKAFFAPQLHTVTASATAGGTISPAGTREYVHGTSATYYLTPDAGYHVEDTLVDTEFVGAVTSYTFPGIEADATIQAIFAANPSWTISASFTGSGTVTPTGDTVVLGGTHQSYTFTPASGYRIGSVIVDGADKGVQTSWTFSNVTADHTVVVIFVADTFNITASAGSNGSIDPAGVTTVSRGTSQSYTFTPDAGYRVQNVLVNGVSQVAPGSYTISNVQADQTISVSFVKLNHTVTSSASAGGTISPLGSREYVEGTSPIYYLTAAAGYHVEDVLVGGVSVGAVTSYTFNSISASAPIHAVFAVNPGWTISASFTGSGTVTPNGDTVVAGGTHQKYTFTPAAGYRIGSVVVDGANKGVQTSWTFSNVTADHTVLVNFIPDTFTLTATSGSNGSIDPAGVTTVARGESQTYTFTPAVGYRVQNVLVNGISKGAPGSYTISNVQANQTISVSFAKLLYNVTAEVTTAGGTISPGGVRQYSHGTSPIYYIVPASGYKVADLLVDGVSVGAVTTYTFTAISAPHTITASFAIK